MARTILNGDPYRLDLLAAVLRERFGPPEVLEREARRTPRPAYDPRSPRAKQLRRRALDRRWQP